MNRFQPIVTGSIVLLLLGVFTTLAGEKVFSPEEHLWNHLHALLYTRVMHDGTTYVHEGIEAPLEREGKFLTEGTSHEQALTVLDEFLKTDAVKLIRDPLPRALFQRDLWYIFDKTAEPSLDHGTEGEDRQPERRQLQKRLAQVMRRLELSDKEIASLPDNYADAVRSRAFAEAFDPEQPDRAFLPPDLLDESSPWVMVNRWYSQGTGLAAPLHVRFTGGRAVFAVFLRLPDGRGATEDYLMHLQPGEENVPQFPEGSQVALLRRTVLVNNHGVLQATHLTESLQLRVFSKRYAQHAYEFTLDRSKLLACKAGGLRPLKEEDESYFNLFNGSIPRIDPIETGQKPVRPLQTCVNCHSGQGIFSMQTIGMGRLEGYAGAARTDLAAQIKLTLEYKKSSYSWGLLQGLREAGAVTTPHRECVGPRNQHTLLLSPSVFLLDTQ